MGTGWVGDVKRMLSWVSERLLEGGGSPLVPGGYSMVGRAWLLSTAAEVAVCGYGASSENLHKPNMVICCFPAQGERSLMR